MIYRNVKTGVTVDRPAADEWLDASSGWERVEETPEQGDTEGVSE